MTKHIALWVALGLSGSGAWAQNNLVTDAFAYNKQGQLDKAKEAIDKAALHEKTSLNAKTWEFRGEIYQAIATSPLPAYKALDPNAIKVAYDSYKKVMELDKKNGPYYGDAEKNSAQLWSLALNDGVTKYQDKKFAEALSSYEIANYIKPEDTTAILYGAYAAEAVQNFDKVKQNYNKLFALGRRTPDMYRTLASYERNAKDDAKALQILQEGRKYFPADKNLALDELSMISTGNQSADAQTKIEETIKLDPNNSSLYATLGSILDRKANDPKTLPADKVKFKSQALANYQKTLELDPNNVDANFNLGVNYYNDGVIVTKKVSNMGINDYNKTGKKMELAAKGLYQKALPYFEKAYGVSPNDAEIKRSLKEVYMRLNRQADATKLGD